MSPVSFRDFLVILARTKSFPFTVLIAQNPQQLSITQTERYHIVITTLHLILGESTHRKPPVMSYSWQCIFKLGMPSSYFSSFSFWQHNSHWHQICQSFLKSSQNQALKKHNLRTVCRNQCASKSEQPNLTEVRKIPYRIYGQFTNS